MKEPRDLKREGGWECGGGGGVDQCLCHKQPLALPAIMGTRYLHGWKARRERANNAYLRAFSMQRTCSTLVGHE